MRSRSCRSWMAKQGKRKLTEEIAAEDQARYKRMKVREYAARKNQEVAEKKRREKEEAQRQHAADGSESA